MEGDLLADADDHFGRSAADVDHQRRLSRQAFRAGAEIGQARLLFAVEDPSRKRKSLPQLSDEGAAVGGVADGAGRDRIDRFDARVLVYGDVVGDRLAGGLDRFYRQSPGQVDSSPEPSHPTLSLHLADSPPGHIGNQQPGRVGADVDHRDSMSIP